MQQKNRGGDVRAVRVAEGEGSIQSIGGPRFGNEMGEFGRSASDVGLVEQTFADAPEEARHCAFEHVPARRKERRPWRNLPSKRNEVVLAAARAMEKENRREVGSAPGSKR